MKTIRPILCWLLLLSPLVAAFSTWAQAPADSGKKAAPKKGAEKAIADPSDIPPGQPNTNALKSALALPVKTVTDRFRQIQLLNDLGRPDLAKLKLAELVKSNPNAAQLAAIANDVGIATVFRLGQDAQLAPEGAALADRILEEYHAAARKPTQLAASIKKLSDPSVLVQADGMRSLIAAGQTAVMPLVNVLADPRRAAEHAVVKSALVKLDKQVVEPLLGVLESNEQALKAQVIEVLGRLDAREAVPQVAAAFVAKQSDAATKEAAGLMLFRIVGAVPTLDEVEVLLRRRANEYFERQVPLLTDADGKVTIYNWDATKKATVPVKYREDEANVALAGRLARDLYKLFPEKAEYRRLFWTCQFDAAAYQAGLDKPVAQGAGSAYEAAKQEPAAAIEDALAFAIEHEHIPGATVAAQLLGEIGHVDMLTKHGATICPLVAATMHPDRRLRYAAVNSVLKLDPTKAYAGSSNIPLALAHFVSSHAQRRALVAHPNPVLGGRVAALLQGAGYRTDLATSGKQFLQLAAASPDYELVFVSSTIDKPAIAETQQLLRQDRRTALIPLGLLEAFEDSHYVKTLAADDPYAIGFPQPLEQASMNILVRDLQAKAGRSALTPEERLAQAKGALGWLGTLAHKDDQKLYDLIRHEGAVMTALDDARLAPAAAEVLARLGTETSQRRLVEYASQDTHALPNRQAAATGFAESVKNFGLRLTRPEILLQYGRYNASALADRGTQQVLGSVLDAIESRSRK